VQRQIETHEKWHVAVADKIGVKFAAK